jgi:predicted aldo/keto reductase-like oxidoreductase
MKYRKFGKLDWESSVLGFGTMRLPQTDENPAHIDEAASTRIIRYAIDHGVNYIDTAYPYHEGHAEPLTGRILKDGYREKVKVATKLPSWLIESSKDYDRYLNEQLEHLQTDKIDFYLLHGLNRESWSKLRDLGVFRWAERAMADGRIGYLGFSFHDEYAVFKEIVDAYDNWTFCQIQYNYMDIVHQAGTRGLKYAAKKGLAVVIMEPLRGGWLTTEPTKKVASVWESAPRKRSSAEWALLWVWQHPEVSLALSGMNTMEQVMENIAITDNSGPDALSPEELALIGRVRKVYRKLRPIPCTNCRYCMPCPNGVDIPRIFEIYNDAISYDNPQAARQLYNAPRPLSEKQRANNCQECEECVELCPQKIPIPELMKKIHAFLSLKQ